MRILLAVSFCALIASVPVAADTADDCKDFFDKFEKCVDKLEGDQKDEARIFMNTLKGTLGMADGLNQGNKTLLNMMCGVTMEEAKKDPDVQKYNCAW